jgi:ATP-dependent DNA helicase RecQ
MRRGRSRGASEDAALISALLAKLLQRGRLPLATLRVERQALVDCGLGDACRDVSQTVKDETGWFLTPGVTLPLTREALMAVAARRAPLELDLEFATAWGNDALFGSPEEKAFWEQWVSDRLGPGANQWFTPQAQLDRLLEAFGVKSNGARRVDFLFAHPAGAPAVIEIDGPEHAATPLRDTQRDAELESVGIPSFRIPNDEIRQGGGPFLNRLETYCRDLLARYPQSLTSQPLADAAIACAHAAKVQFALARALAAGWLKPGGDWKISLHGAGKAAGAAVFDACDLIRGFDLIYGTACAPRALSIDIDGAPFEALTGGNAAGLTQMELSTDTTSTLSIAIEAMKGPFHALPSGAHDIVLRPAYLPFDFAAEHVFLPSRRKAALPSIDAARAPLTLFLQQIFRKKSFRDLQTEGVYNALRQQDCIVLLPTGAGKSIIYQLAGLLMPGVTLVVDPITALIEDQVEGLARYGIDRAAPIMNSLSTPKDRAQLLLRIERGEYQFILHSPERLQSPQFRATLRALAESSLVNLAVIDEAHCVSEWGHDFRPAYLNLGRNIRRFGRDKNGTPPPLMALTGTASRAVLRDVLAELEIDRARSDALIRPTSFDRRELSFYIVRTTPADDANAALRGVINAMPQHFGMPRAEFFRPAGHDTYSGLIFVPFVNGRVYGVTDVANQIGNATASGVTIYSGGAPRGFNPSEWDRRKQANAQDFKRNRTPILVSTKAFGMGIDKPNIRYTVHFGLPGSLESFYQEAGRAGRDRKNARCTLVYSEFDPRRSDAMLDPTLSLNEVRALYDETRTRRDLDDDVTRALWFHTRAFVGEAEEIADIARVLKSIANVTKHDRQILPFWEGDDDSKRQEKAIFRLVQVGVFTDYEVDFGGQHYVVDIQAFDLEGSRARLIDYAHAAQPARARLFAKQLAEIREGSPHELALRLARALIDFIYNVVERSRRRALQEAVLLARTAKDDAAIRARLLDYLQEGMGAEQIERLVEDDDINLDQWCELLERVHSAVDAGELRGLAIRALESFPEHPGLLLVRGVSEMMCSDASESIAVQALHAALRGTIIEYELDDSAVSEAVTFLFDLAGAKADGLRAPLTMALFRICDEEAVSETFRCQVRSQAQALGHPTTQVVIAAFSLGKARRTLVEAADRAAARWSSAILAKLR